MIYRGEIYDMKNYCKKLSRMVKLIYDRWIVIDNAVESCKELIEELSFE